MENILLNQNFLYSCAYEKKRGSEQFVADHALSYLVAGETHFHTPEGLKVLKEGEIALIKRNQLVKAFKIPSLLGEYRSISVQLSQNILQKYALENEIKINKQYKAKSILTINQNPFVKGYFDSLLPYFEVPAQMTETIGLLKVREALELVVKHFKDSKEMLFDFNEPFKIDLEAYMNKNYTFNVALSQFAKLTGRSLATFKRDFYKIFNTTPERWLQRKRLEHAHYLIAEKKQGPREVFVEVGFENFSHFSTAFKRYYGYNASSLKR